MEFLDLNLQAKDFCEYTSKDYNKKSQMHSMQVIAGFGNWGNPHDSLIQGHHRGPVLEVKNKLQKWCEVMDVDEFHTSKLCCHCHCEMSKVKYYGKEINSVFCCSNNECGILLIMISIAQGTFLFRKRGNLKHSAI
jgi:hypothetical protein